jgi:NAD(P)-dependent dehydrogenase (short-subunit alcohol dehydrogenase family)
MGLLDRKVAIITGASSGIGRAAARLFAAEGAAVVLVSRRQAELADLKSEIEALGGKAAVVAGDVRTEDTAKASVAAAQMQFGGLDIAFNNAGVLGPMGATATIEESAWREALDANLTGSFLGAKHQIPALLARGGGSLIFTSTFVGHTVGFPGVAAYAASKAGLIGLTQSLAAELGPNGVRVNALLPGAVETPMFHTMNGTKEAQSFIAGLHALKRVSTPEELANSALYLASDLSKFQTGTAMLVDGGVSINRT